MEKKRLIFDIDGTLLKADWDYETKYFESVLSSEEVRRFLPNVGRLLEDYEMNYPKYDVEMLSRHLTSQTGVMITPEIINGWSEALANTHPVVIDGVREALEHLKSQDRSLVVLTNWFLDPQKERLVKAELAEYFDDVFGGEMGIKPSKKSYLNACGSIPVEDCAMIGDSLEMDVYGAYRVGIDAVYYNPTNKDGFDKTKVKSIGSMKQLKEMF